MCNVSGASLDVFVQGTVSLETLSVCHGGFFTLQREGGEWCNRDALTAAMAVLDAFLVCADTSCCQHSSVYHDP